MPSNTEAIVRINHAGREQMRAAVAAGVTEVFAQDIWPEAVRNSRVKTGHNRRSIAVEVNAFGVETAAQSGSGELAGVAAGAAEGVKAAIYTQSGYGGFLEVGTRFMQGIPYIYPAVMKFINAIGDAVRRKLEL